MKRLMALAAIAAGAAGIVALASQAAGAAPDATPSNTGQGNEVACVVQAGNAFSSCLDITVNGSVSSSTHAAAASGSVQVDKTRAGSGSISKIQIDRVAVGTQHTGIASSGAVNSGTPPKPISASTSGADPSYMNCAIRYHVVLDYAVRLTNGQLKTGSYVGPWFDSSYAACAGSNYGQSVSAVQCFLHSPEQACVRVTAAAARSNDGKSLYARGTITAPEGVNGLPGSDEIARVQVDSAVFGRQSATVRTSPSMNSRDARPLSAMGQTSPGYAWTKDCTIHYQAALNYSVRLTDGRLFTGRIATPTFKAPGC